MRAAPGPRRPASCMSRRRWLLGCQEREPWRPRSPCASRVAASSWATARRYFQRGRVSISLTTSRPPGASALAAGAEQREAGVVAEQVEHVDHDDARPSGPVGRASPARPARTPAPTPVGAARPRPGAGLGDLGAVDVDAVRPRAPARRRPGRGHEQPVATAHVEHPAAGRHVAASTAGNGQLSQRTAHVEPGRAGQVGGSGRRRPGRRRGRPQRVIGRVGPPVRSSAKVPRRKPAASTAGAGRGEQQARPARRATRSPSGSGRRSGSSASPGWQPISAVARPGGAERARWRRAGAAGRGGRPRRARRSRRGGASPARSAAPLEAAGPGGRTATPIGAAGGGAGDPHGGDARAAGPARAPPRRPSGHRWRCWWVSTWVSGTPDRPDPLELGGELPAEVVGVDPAGGARGRNCRHERAKPPRRSTSVGTSRALTAAAGPRRPAARWAPTPRPSGSPDEPATRPASNAGATASIDVERDARRRGGRRRSPRRRPRSARSRRR